MGVQMTKMHLPPSGGCGRRSILIVITPRRSDLFGSSYAQKWGRRLWWGVLVGCWLIRCKRIYNFWCSMLVLHQLLYVLFTLQCQFLFSAVFLFQVFTKGNILRIGRNTSQTSYFSWHEDGVQSRDGGGHRGSHTIGWCSPWPCHRMVWAPWVPSNIALPPIKCLRHENPKSIGILPRKVPQRRRHRRWVSRDRSLCSCTVPGWVIAPKAISIDSTAIFIVVADSHDEEGVVLPWGWGLYR
jgi:hypothetical protein